ncbi:MAG: RNA recognition motif-containing protein [Planctomycetota bacterium]|jgi:RNA recognition motif-containing protein
MSSRIFVGNLSWDTTLDSLRQAFEGAGHAVEDVHIVLDRENGRPRGFGYVEFSDDKAAKAAIRTMEGHQVDGRPIRTSEARERTPRR